MRERERFLAGESVQSIRPIIREGECATLVRMELNIQDLATKDDLAVSLKALEWRLIIKLGGMMVVAVGVIVALLVFINAPTS